MSQHINCNCGDCIWKRIMENAEKIEISTKRNLKLNYRIQSEQIIWIPKETTQKKLFNVSKQEIINCLEARKQQANPSEYPGVAPSYKWAILNHPKIWLGSRKL